jgi:putative nucleotidyltransferase with HDIG domain
VPAVQCFIDRAQRLPAAPTIVLKVLELTRSLDGSTEAISDLVEREPILSARLLKLANSPFFGLRRQVETARRAVVVLGLKTVASMAMVVWTHTLCLSSRDRSLQGIYQQSFKHGLAVAVFSRGLVERLDPGARETAFQAGLLHDIGRVALCAELGPRYWERILYLPRGGSPVAELIERRQLGFDHAELGAALMLQWGLPVSLVEAAAAHHSADAGADGDRIILGVALANRLARQQGWDLLPPAEAAPPLAAMQRFGLADDRELAQFMSASGTQLAGLMTSVG